MFRPRFYPADQYIPVIADENGVLTCIEIGALLGLQTLTIGKQEGRYVPFVTKYGISQTLTEMMSDLLRFHNWYKENVYSTK